MIFIGLVFGSWGIGNQVNYVVFKVGVIGMVCLIVCELLKVNVIVNVVVLGYIDIDMICVLDEWIQQGVL